MRNLWFAALAAPLLLGTAYAAPRQPIGERKAPPAPALVERNHDQYGQCGPTTYTIVVPKPGAKPTPVTKQFQPIHTCTPDYVVCDSKDKGKCQTVYKTSSYRWLSTEVPCYNGIATVTRVDQLVTIAAHPTNKIETCRCEEAGTCYYGTTSTHVAEPTQFPYVNTGWNYHVCNYADYYKWYSGDYSPDYSGGPVYTPKNGQSGQNGGQGGYISPPENIHPQYYNPTYPQKEGQPSGTYRGEDMPEYHGNGGYEMGRVENNGYHSAQGGSDYQGKTDTYKGWRSKGGYGKGWRSKSGYGQDEKAVPVGGYPQGSYPQGGYPKDGKQWSGAYGMEGWGQNHGGITRGHNWKSLQVECKSCMNGICKTYPVGYVSKTVTKLHTYRVPYHINSYFPHKTTFCVSNLGITLTVYGPTSLRTVITGTTTVTTSITTTETTTVTATQTKTKTETEGPGPTAQGNGEVFFLGCDLPETEITEPELLAGGKRPKGFVVCANNICTIRNGCKGAQQFRINSELQLTNGARTVMAFANNGDISKGSALLRLGTGEITQAFSFNGDGLAWAVEGAGGGRMATFCKNADNTITVVFDGSNPGGCESVRLFRVNPFIEPDCLGESSSSTGPSTGVSSSEAPTTGPSTERPSTNASSTAKPTSGEPSKGAPTSVEPTSEVPTGSASTESSSGAPSEGRTTAEPTSAEPTSTKPSSGAPTEEPSSAEPISAEPTEAPTSTEPTTAEPSPAEPTTEASDIDPCAIEALISAEALVFCKTRGGKVPKNLVGCITDSDTADHECIVSCNKNFDSVFLAQQCLEKSSTVNDPAIRCAEMGISGGSDVLYKACVTLQGGAPCSPQFIKDQGIEDADTYITECAAAGIISNGVKKCVDKVRLRLDMGSGVNGRVNTVAGAVGLVEDDGDFIALENIFGCLPDAVDGVSGYD
ncbi:hypothetical protein TWF730_004401 [Orbilia blumenaviensis]|uniref:DUF7908 domain-containing protein n=1 Tax=Orbilia blumenaviensis TaxID=1796055 RepID=A0AAV9U1J9_9PEZI